MQAAGPVCWREKPPREAAVMTSPRFAAAEVVTTWLLVFARAVLYASYHCIGSKKHISAVVGDDEGGEMTEATEVSRQRFVDGVARRCLPHSGDA